MARNKSSFGKANNYLTKAEKKRVKEGSMGLIKGEGLSERRINDFNVNDNRGKRGLDTRRPAIGKSKTSIVHAILFVVLLVIVVSWALGY